LIQDVTQMVLKPQAIFSDPIAIKIASKLAY